MTTNAEKDHFLYHIRNREDSSGFGFDGYIGITDDPSRRKRQHFDALSKGSHTNERLQEAYNEDPKNIEFVIANSGNKGEMEARERLLVPKPNHHWNKQTGGGPSRGMSIDEAIDATSSSKHQAAGSQESEQSQKANAGSSKTHKNSSSDANSGSGPHTNKGSDGKVAGASRIGAVVADCAATAGMITATFGSGLGTAFAINKTLLKDDPALGKDECDARSAGRFASYTGGGLGATGAMVAIYGAGEVGLGVAGISSGLTAIGGTAVGGFAIAVAVPAAAAAVTAGAVYGGYKLYKWFAK